ncbi:unnamed protein product [Ectocarpus sp. CCAP 1310/34]|nr:unnamed protein product [Ectocarpus sp. CCAP 1310/34]
MANSQLQALAKVRGMLDFVLHPSSPDTSGIPVKDERLQKVTEWMSKKEDLIDGELLPDASQVDIFVLCWAIRAPYVSLVSCGE